MEVIWAPIDLVLAQVLAQARAVDEAADRGQDVRPLCGLAFAVKDNIDVVGYRTEAGTPALEGQSDGGAACSSRCMVWQAHASVAVRMVQRRMHSNPALRAMLRLQRRKVLLQTFAT